MTVCVEVNAIRSVLNSLHVCPFDFQVSVLCDNTGLFRLRAAIAGLLHSGCEEVVVWSTILLSW